MGSDTGGTVAQGKRENPLWTHKLEYSLHCVLLLDMIEVMPNSGS